MNRSLQRLLELDAHYSQSISIVSKPGLLRSIAALLAHSGDSWFWLSGLLLLWWFGGAYWKERAFVMIVSISLTALVVFTIKFTVRRQRPKGEWGDIYRKTDPHSFPSGHAARATLLAVLAVELGPAWFGLLLAIWAPLVVLARVVMGVHYLSDVLAGALLGLLLGVLILQVYALIDPQIMQKFTFNIFIGAHWHLKAHAFLG